MNNYWVVGATWVGDDQKKKFFQLGYWEMGWDDNDKPTLAEKRDQIRKNDRIAIKRMDGKGQKTVTIHGIGIVRGVDNKRVHIDWILTDLKRKVPAHGCFGTIHGPYDIDDEWTNKVFTI